MNYLKSESEGYPSEFERGYNSGKASCAISAPATEFWLCWTGSTEENTFTAATGRTKIEATLALGARTIARHRVDCEAHK